MSDPSRDDATDDQQQYDDDAQHYSGDGGGEGDGAPPHPDDDAEAEEEDPSALQLPSDHRLLAPLQAALKRELQARDDRVTLAMREREATLLATKKAREELGVELYSTQQGLAKLQIELEKRQSKYERAAATRAQQEIVLKQALETYQKTCAMRDELEKKRSVTKRWQSVVRCCLLFCSLTASSSLIVYLLLSPVQTPGSEGVGRTSRDGAADRRVEREGQERDQGDASRGVRDGGCHAAGGEGEGETGRAAG